MIPLFNAFENQIYPFDQLVDELDLDRDTSRHPLFDIMVVMQTIEQTQFTFENIEIAPLKTETTLSKFDMTFYFYEMARDIQVEINYNTDLFRKERMELIYSHFKTLLTSILKNPGLPIDRLSILSKKEEVYARDFTRKIPVIKRPTVIDLFLEKKEQHPAKPAIVFDGGELTYSQLDQLTDHIAVRLQDLGTMRGIPAAVMFGIDVRQETTPIGYLQRNQAKNT
jgi:non-ribosomal peptide synthetase component F